MVVLAGLGNPGRDYADHRHNIGFMLLDRIVREHDFPSFKKKSGYALTEGRVGNQKVLLVKPLRYMNRSGEPLHEVMGFYKTPLDDLIVIHDDIDLAPGKIKLKQGGGHGGHNGLRDIDHHLGTDYRRLRLGVGRPPHAKSSDKMVDSHVLSNFTKDEWQGWLNPLLDCMTKHLDLLVGDDDNAFMTTVTRLCPSKISQEDDHGI
jgi:PTH1 family peptidyl-tRNA hydrolase